jgi:hypothetical protein
MNAGSWLARTAWTLACGMLAVSASAHEIAVRIEGPAARAETLALPAGARLSDAALHATLAPQAYLLGAALMRTDQVEPQRRLQAGLLFDLSNLRAQALQQDNDALADWAAATARWLEALPVTGRLPAMLDPRVVEAQASANIPLADGDRLRYPRRPASIRVVGAVARSCELPHVALQDARSYLAACPTLALADRDWIDVVQPDGRVFRQGIALWNRSTPLALAPGALIVVPLREALAKRLAPDLNQELADFLATQPLDGTDAD